MFGKMAQHDQIATPRKTRTEVQYEMGEMRKMLIKLVEHCGALLCKILRSLLAL